MVQEELGDIFGMLSTTEDLLSWEVMVRGKGMQETDRRDWGVDNLQFAASSDFFFFLVMGRRLQAHIEYILTTFLTEINYYWYFSLVGLHAIGVYNVLL